MFTFINIIELNVTMIEFILGGARSGKSRFAEQRAIQLQLPVVYIATAQALDAEMQQRILHHQQQRPKDWQVIEEPINLTKILKQYQQKQQIILVDCLTLWLSNLVCHHPEKLSYMLDEFLHEVATHSAHLIFVSNETGLGVVPMGELSRIFVDESGRLHQRLAALADRVIFCIAGLPMPLKGEQ